MFTGITVSAKTQQRLVQRQAFELPTSPEVVSEVSLDGGTVRLIPPPGSKAEQPV